MPDLHKTRGICRIWREVKIMKMLGRKFLLVLLHCDGILASSLHQWINPDVTLIK